MKLLLIGAGNMGSAILKNLINYNITVVEKNQKRTEELKWLYPDITFLSTPPEITDYVVILAVKPQVLDTLELRGRAFALISILAGVPLSTLKYKVQAKYYIRAMPNIAALRQKSVTSLTGDIEFKEGAIEILSSIGKTIWLNSEKELDIATGLAGSSPAWLALVAEALSDGAVALGLPREKAYEYLPMLFEGVGALLEDQHPAILKDKVMSPAGTTACGYAKLEEGGVRNSFIEAIKSAYQRSQELRKG
jgi:pyrroline-5-carboxylate reductase